MHIRFASDQSADALRLKRDLETSGYLIENVLSGSPHPVAICDTLYVAGSRAIRDTFVDRLKVRSVEMAVSQKRYMVHVDLVSRDPEARYRLQMFSTGVAVLDRRLAHEDEAPGLILAWLQEKDQRYLATFPSVASGSSLRYYIIAEPK